MVAENCGCCYLWRIWALDHVRKPQKLSWGPFLEIGPVKPLQNLEPCDYRAVLFTYSKDVGGSLHTRSFRRIHFPVFRYRWSKNGFAGLKTFRGFREKDPWPGTRTYRLQCCFIHVFLIWSGSLYTRSSSRVHLSVFRYRSLKISLQARKLSEAFER